MRREKYPTIIKDDFFDDPIDIQTFALQQEYGKTRDGAWPGLRTVNLAKTHQDFTNYFLDLLLKKSCFPKIQKNKIRLKLYFQSIEKFTNDANNLVNKGFIHHDDTYFDKKSNDKVESSILVYLNQNYSLYSGTTIFTSKFKDTDIYYGLDIKHKKYLHDIVDDDYDEKIIRHWDIFEEDLDCKNKFNRFFMFDASQYHGVKSYYYEGNEPRLTLIAFTNII